MKVVSEFATDTCHKETELNNVNTSVIIKKFLATQAPIAKWYKVYPFVSDDISRIEFRAPNQLDRWANGVELPVGTLESILGKVSNAPLFKYAVIKDYLDQVKPPVGRELHSLFLHGQQHKNLHDYPFEQDPELHKRILQYKPDKSFSEKQLAREIGSFIKDLEFKPEAESELIECGTCGGKNKDEKDRSGEEEEEEDNYGKAHERDRLNLKDHVQTEWLAQHERELRGNPVMQAFKKENQLPTQFPSVKAAKQLILSSVSPQLNSLDREKILGKRQTEIKGVPVNTVDTSDWKHLLSVVDSFKPETIDAIVNTDQCKRFARLTKRRNYKNKTELVKALISEHSPYNLYGEYNKRYLSSYDNGLNPEIIQAIIKD